MIYRPRFLFHPPPLCLTNLFRQGGHQTLTSSSKEMGSRMRHMIGSVDQVSRWYKAAKNTDLEIIFEVAGILESKINKGDMQLLLIRSESGHVIQGVFYPIDRELPAFPAGAVITATGKMLGSNKIHIFDAVQIRRDDMIAVQRLAFLSQRAMEEAL